jgi:hypothetical protein
VVTRCTRPPELHTTSVTLCTTAATVPQSPLKFLTCRQPPSNHMPGLWRALWAGTRKHRCSLIGLVTPTTTTHLIFIYSNEQNATAVDGMRCSKREQYPLISVWNYPPTTADIHKVASFLRNVQSPAYCQCLQ